MTRRLLQLLLQSMIAFAVLFTATFLLVRSLPEGPFQNPAATPEHLRPEIARFHGLGQPCHTQFLLALQNLKDLDGGPSIRHDGRQVRDIIAQGLPVTLLLCLCAMLVATAAGLPAGALAATKPKSLAGHAASAWTMLFLCLPPMVIGPLLAESLAVQRQWLPAVGWDRARLETWVLPTVTLGLAGGACLSRLVRNALSPSPPRALATAARHGKKPHPPASAPHSPANRLASAVTCLGPSFAAIVSGSLVVESIFHLPGLGLHFLRAVNGADTPLIQATVLIYGALIVAAGFLTGVVRCWLTRKIPGRQRRSAALPPGPQAAATPTPPPHQSPGTGRLRRLPRNRLAVASLIVLGVIALACLLAPVLAHLAAPSPSPQGVGCHSPGPPATTGFDHHLLIQALAAGRGSLAVGVLATMLVLGIAGIWGIVAACGGGWLDATMRWLADTLAALPLLCFAILLMGTLDPQADRFTTWAAQMTGWSPESISAFTSQAPLIIALAALAWPALARVVRNQTHAAANAEPAVAARDLGLGRTKTLWRHILPEIRGPVIAATILTVPAVMLCETALSFLRCGVQAPASSWGCLLATGADHLFSRPSLLLVPATFLATTLLAFTVLGDNLHPRTQPTDPKD